VTCLVAAWRGQETGALDLIEAGFRDATGRGEGRSVTLAEYATAVLYNARKNPLLDRCERAHKGVASPRSEARARTQ
jgi:hypothetical protein